MVIYVLDVHSCCSCYFLYKGGLNQSGILLNMRLTNLFSLIPVLAVYAQDLSIAVVEQAFNNANASISCCSTFDCSDSKRNSDTKRSEDQFQTNLPS